MPDAGMFTDSGGARSVFARLRDALGAAFGTTGNPVKVSQVGKADVELVDAASNPIGQDAGNPLWVTGAAVIGGAVTIADGADVAEGAIADAAVQGDTAGTVSAKLRGINKTLSAGIGVTGPLTDTQLRATPVPVSGTVTASGPLTDTQLRATPVPVSGTVTASGPLTDTQLRATPVPVSGTVTASGPLTDTQLRATPVPVSGTVTASGPLTDTQLRASPVPMSLASLPALAAGSAIAAAVYRVSGAVVDAAGNVLTVKTSAPANVAASSTDSSIITAVASRKLRVLSVYAVAGATATTLTFNTKPAGGGTAISALLANGANGGVVLPSNPDGWFQTNSGEGLTVTTGAGSTTGLQVNYVEVP